VRPGSRREGPRLRLRRPPPQEARVPPPLHPAHQRRCRNNGISYSKFIGGLKRAGIDLNRKMLADIAANEPASFTILVDKAKTALA